MRIEIAKDKNTGFPCIREKGKGEFISLFPVTKFQVEQCIYEGCFRDYSNPQLSDLIRRFVFREINKTEQRRPVYPEKILCIGRGSIDIMDKESIANIVATNLTLWNNNAQLYSHGLHFPAEKSEWRIVLDFLGGKVPLEQEWDNALTLFSKVKTYEMVTCVLESGMVWPDTVRYLLEKYSETLSDQDFGLPFQNRFFYELTKEPKSAQRKHEPDPVGNLDYKLPNVVGDSNHALWPTIGNPGVNRNHSVLNEFVPVVALRVWYSEHDVFRDNENLQLYFHGDLIIHNIQGSVSDDPVHKARISKAPSRRGTMKLICPICYREIDPQVFQNKRPLWHTEKREMDEEGNPRSVYSHSNERQLVGSINIIPIHADYLKIARKDNPKINSVTLSGFTKSGKTCYMLSLLAMHLYPYGNSYINRYFPKKWDFANQWCHMFGLNNNEMLEVIENAFITGILPARTTELAEAFRTPILYNINAKYKNILNPGKKDDRILIINDIAGEVIARPVRLLSDKRLHVKQSTDIIFLHPARDIKGAIEIFDLFIAGLGTIESEEKTLTDEMNKINLIFVLNMIDELNPAIPEEKELLDIILTEPYQLPQKNDETECLNYFNSMKIVHKNLEAWIHQKYPDLVKYYKRFNSVRFCGISSFGFPPVLENRRSIPFAHENYVPFGIQPIRVMDPIFWILYDNHFFNFQV